MKQWTPDLYLRVVRGVPFMAEAVDRWIEDPTDVAAPAPEKVSIADVKAIFEMPAAQESAPAREPGADEEEDPFADLGYKK